MVTFNDYTQALRLLEGNIAAELIKFERYTGTTVADVELRRIDTTTMSGPSSSMPGITITVEL